MTEEIFQHRDTTQPEECIEKATSLLNHQNDDNPVELEESFDKNGADPLPAVPENDQLCILEPLTEHDQTGSTSNLCTLDLETITGHGQSNSSSDLCTLDLEAITEHDQTASTSNLNTSQSICRICHCGNADEKLLTPCKCRGTSQFVHGSCLVGWFSKKRNKTCELCLYEVKIKRRGLKPFSKWTFPRRSCDFVGFLFAFYGVILLIFVIMILRIASNGCKSTVCVVLYFVSVISLIYFSYCCGFVEQTKRCWRTYLDLNRKVIIENREDSCDSVSSVV